MLEARFGSGGFLGEHLWLGHLGDFFIVLSLVSALIATLSFFAEEYASADFKKSWKTMARSFFVLHGLSVLFVFVLLFIMILNQYFEYHYAWRHSSKALPLKYIISSFWEGQEGSFLLWQFWLVILGFVGIKTLREWESPVMGVVALIQFFLGSMVLGITILGYKIGSNPFVLLRAEMAVAPIFQQPDYLTKIADGNGLSPLLQNYWMTIHPPVLFCGFASTAFPFAFVIASLLRADFKGWVKPAMPWALFSMGILGTGILMGGAWAYESLSFGGFWAWDPVENMSFVPWLLIVAGLHLHLIYKYTSHSIFSSFLFYILGFVTVLYSTFLTRSGILGDTSVHAFTDLGMTGQLLIYLFVFLVPSLLLLGFRYKSMPSVEKEEELFSREFWLFMGALIILLSAVQMTFTTSIPVWNKLFNLSLAPPENVINHYNKWQIIFGILAALGMSISYYLSYKLNRVSEFIKWLWVSFLAALVMTILAGYFLVISPLELIELKGYKLQLPSPFFIMLWASLGLCFSMLFYCIKVLKFNLKIMGGAVAHFGFGLFLVGVLISQYKKETISLNKAGIDFGKEFKAQEKAENLLLIRDSMYEMNGYEITYKGMNDAPPNIQYQIDYVKRASNQGEILEQFSLFPNAQLNPKMGLVANPDTKHYFTRDIFTHVSSVPDNSKLKDTLTVHDASVKDTFFAVKSILIFNEINADPPLPEGFLKEGKVLVGAQLEVKMKSGKSVIANPVYCIDLKQNNQVSSLPFVSKDLGISVDIIKINPTTHKVTFAIREEEKPTDFVILKAIVFPYINLVWLGGILCFLGTFMSMWKRAKEGKSTVVSAS